MMDKARYYVVYYSPERGMNFMLWRDKIETLEDVVKFALIGVDTPRILEGQRNGPPRGG